ncbi:MAG: hypothetical protein C5B46_01215 [Proteobacteria bacterium]|nr:MAG: hypothetical protein C5B46_01215 [Pseudomonadota bacterium]
MCSDLFVAEETRELSALYNHIPLGFVDSLRDELTRKLELPAQALSRDRFSVHGCGPVGLHDDFFRYPRFFFAIVVVHSGRLGLIDASSRAVAHEPGEIILLDPRAKHGLVREGTCAEEHIYESTHSPVHDELSQFMFLDFDVARVELRRRFRLRHNSLI